MKLVSHPPVQDLDLARVLQALGDPVRLRLAHMLALEKNLPCSALCLGRPKSSMSHHFKIMIDAGVLRVDVVGNTHLNNLRCDDLESRFPGLLTSILRVREIAEYPLARSRKSSKRDVREKRSGQEK